MVWQLEIVHIQRSYVSCGRSPAAHVRTVAPAIWRNVGSSMPTRPPPGTPQAGEEDPDQELYVAVPDGPGGRATYYAL